MKIVKIKGGLGNQLFQYSFAILMQRLTNDDLKLDMTTYQELMNDPIRRPRLLKLKINLPIASDNEIKKICIIKHNGNMISAKYRMGIGLEAMLNGKYFFERNRGYINPETLTRYSYYDGYWQSWKNVDEVWDTLKQQLTPNCDIRENTKTLIDRISTENSVFIGVRKGDYENASEHFGSFGNTYYQKAMDYITEHIENPVFYVFSNDIPWVKENIDFSNRTVFFREPEDVIDDFEDLLIMAACKHSIIINSTYHWWGARLNEYPGKIVVAPKKWFFDDKPIDIVPPRWVRIEE